ncbi:globin [Photobacterium aquae]|uniref:Globin n=1 Tax=Photobacterium aquae TaxID=1195763 RepID=A0A0J1JRA9_9GAMM|nr:group II truncated hemoglobin [Photobacterium aquae]KLV04797.1 globin [Photobacterium aquae]
MKPYRANEHTIEPRTAPNFNEGDTAFIAAGGESGVRQLVESFYAMMDALPEAAELRAMHADDLSESIEKLTTFLIGWLGGPSRYSEKYGAMNLPGAHRHVSIGMAEKNAWLLCMEKALAEQGYDDLFQRHVMVQLAFPAEMCRNRQ